MQGTTLALLLDRDQAAQKQGKRAASFRSARAARADRASDAQSDGRARPRDRALREGAAVSGEQLAQARQRVGNRREWLESLRASLRDHVALAQELDLEPFPHGTLGVQLTAEVNAIRAELGLSGHTLRRRRRAIPRERREEVFERDGYRCKECGWQCPTVVEPAPAGLAARECARLRRLTIEHRLPVAEGGTNAVENLLTCCSWCNQEKGRDLPEAA
jgi:5-methylcytosine-specific restriction endonuclease McrA